MSPIRVTIPQSIRCFCDGASVVEARGATVGEVLTDLRARYPDFACRLFDEGGQPSAFIRIFADEAEIGTLQGLETPVRTEVTLHMLAGAAGG